jgi:hypothetical protein
MNASPSWLFGRRAPDGEPAVVASCGSPSRCKRATPIASQQIGNDKSLAFIGSASAQNERAGDSIDAEALSITRLEGSRWRGGRAMELQPGSSDGPTTDRAGVFTEGETIGWCGSGTARVCFCRESDSKSAETGRYRDVWRRV